MEDTMIEMEERQVVHRPWCITYDDYIIEINNCESISDLEMIGSQYMESRRVREYDMIVGKCLKFRLLYLILLHRS